MGAWWGLMSMGMCIHAYGGYISMGIRLHVLKGLGWPRIMIRMYMCND